jgi:hypothetical protein
MLPLAVGNQAPQLKSTGFLEAALRRWTAWAMTEERASHEASFRLSTTDSEGS